MQRAMRLARKGWGRTSPNPIVGAVVARNTAVVGEGYHRAAGQPHAEVEALAAAGEAARGATLYVTLEPCCTHGRTPPCTEAIIAAGIQRVVVGTVDPNPAHAGRGLHALRTAGVQVETAPESAPYVRLNEAFNCWIRYDRPYVVLKLALTLDGRIATAEGSSQWITGEQARNRVQRLRQWADAVMVGAETVRRDDPQLLVRRPRNWPCQPLRLVASHSGDLGASPQLLHDGRAPTRVLSCADAQAWRQELQRLGADGVTALLVEGGGELAADLLQAGVIDKVSLFMAPMLLGGRNSRPAVGGRDPASLAEALQLTDCCWTKCGKDYHITGYLTDVHGNC